MHMGLIWEAKPQMKSVYRPQKVCPYVAHISMFWKEAF